MKKNLLAITLSIYLLLIVACIVLYASPIHSIFLNEDSQRHDKNYTLYLLNDNHTYLENLTEREASHMEDVYVLGQQIRIFIGLLTIPLLLSFIIAAQGTRQYVTTISFYITLGVVGVIALLFIDFTASFDVFHRIFFPQGNYAFPAQSQLISTYSETFFATLGIIIAGLWIASSAAAYLLCNNKRTR